MRIGSKAAVEAPSVEVFLTQYRTDLHWREDDQRRSVVCRGEQRGVVHDRLNLGYQERVIPDKLPQRDGVETGYGLELVPQIYMLLIFRRIRWLLTASDDKELGDQCSQFVLKAQVGGVKLARDRVDVVWNQWHKLSKSFLD